MQTGDSHAEMRSRPAFILCSVRSGSTLLRSILDSHSQIHAPHELHLAELKIDISDQRVATAMATLGLGAGDLKFMLWDRLVDDLLRRSGKRLLVDKTPGNTWIWKDLAERWPEARFIILRRDPAAAARSLAAAMVGSAVEDDAVALIVDFVEELEQAAAGLPGHLAISYEDLVATPEATIMLTCDHLGVDYEPSMLNYGAGAERTYRFGIGDWGTKIASGSIQDVDAARLDPGRWPDLARVCRAWGYPA